MIEPSASKPSEELFTQLASRFEAHKDSYARLDSDADTRIVRWCYAERSVFELRADFFRRFNEKPGKLTDVEPIEAYMYYAYGYDAQDRIIYSAFFQSEELPRTCTFYQYDKDYIETAEYTVELYTEHYYLVQVSRVIQPHRGYPTVYGDYGVAEGSSRYFYEKYHYDLSGRLSHILSHSESLSRPLSPAAQGRIEQVMEEQRVIARLLRAEDTLDSTIPHLERLLQGEVEQPPDLYIEESYEYDGKQLLRIVSRSRRMLADGSFSDHEYIMYEAPRKGETKNMLFEAARVSLLEAIVEHVRLNDSAELQKRVYNLQISYNAVADDGFVLMLAPQAQREAWEHESDQRDYDSLFYHQLSWKPTYIEIWQLPDAYARFLRDFRREERWDDIRKLMVRVAQDLNERNWGDMLNITDDFIVFALDYEALEDIQDEIRACVPKEKINFLKVKGLLG